jgi:hypothetical protein
MHNATGILNKGKPTQEKVQIITGQTLKKTTSIHACTFS